jgi:threonine/homoserine/homoserine lactone efflux protein
MSFIPDLPVLLAFTLAGVVLFATPGPDMSLWLARTLQGGRRAGMAAMLGTSTGCLIHSALAAGGISVLIAASQFAFGALKVVGALYLLWLAWSTVRSGSVLPTGEAPQVAHPLPLARTYLGGLAVNLANPKVVIFFITFLPGFVSASDPHAAGKLMVLGLWFVAFNFGLATLLILGADGITAALRRNPAVVRAIDWVFAGVFGVFALAILRAQARP